MKQHQEQQSFLQSPNGARSLYACLNGDSAQANGENNMENSLSKPFQGSGGRTRLINALMSQSLIRDEDLATAIALRVRLEQVPAGTEIIEQGGADTDLFLILQGAFSVAVDGSVVACRKAGEHVGEMAVVDPDAPRSASVTATRDSVVARISESDFSALADRYPRLWRRIALELVSRVRNSNTSNYRDKPHSMSLRTRLGLIAS
jgi:CRP/FNR family transcriptional regulator, cyclic AMP receptor protein